MLADGVVTGVLIVSAVPETESKPLDTCVSVEAAENEVVPPEIVVVPVVELFAIAVVMAIPAVAESDKFPAAAF